MQIRLNKWSGDSVKKKSALLVGMRILCTNVERYFSIPKQGRKFQTLIIIQLVYYYYYFCIVRVYRKNRAVYEKKIFFVNYVNLNNKKKKQHNKTWNLSCVYYVYILTYTLVHAKYKLNLEFLYNCCNLFSNDIPTNHFRI